MGTRRVPVDWEELEWALTDHGGETSHYLDLGTGMIELSQEFGSDGDGLSEDEVEEGIDDGRLIYIEPLPSSVEYRWMEEFAGSMKDESLRKQLAVALDGRGSFRRFKDVLGPHASERERWFAFRWERLVREMREWLADNDIHRTTEPRAR